MKNLLLITGLLFQSVFCVAQDIPQSQVPSVVVNSFKQQFPKATDVEWELKGDQYQVEFEIGLADHEAWIDATGKIVTLRQEIPAKDLPEAVKTTIKRDFDGYRTTDTKKITDHGTITYKAELKKFSEEWDVTFSQDGKILDKKAD